MELLRGAHLTKTFPEAGGEQIGIRDVSFTLQEGEMLGVVGESGSGKSTLLRVIAGLIRPQEGELFYQGKSYLGKRPQEIGRFLQMVFQDAQGSFDPRMIMRRSVTETVRGEVNGAELSELLERLRLSEKLLDKKPLELSGGECQRMSITRALLGGAQILLCDEITSALDVKTQQELVELLKEMRLAKKLSIIFVSHDLDLVEELCDRVLLLQDGKVQK
ncbi:MAG: dipeptide/oligopeptide/nickel ABC transporter ATP-binding protein [Lachnospiraceae bacterium]|nr:dipeptide/oligopeptide/nickel ABC transporter ATP-binding protein [Lachnospiraceae bacterium]